MDIIQIIVLSIVQGLTEFLPVSSSAHLILVPILTGWEDQGLAFDVAVHIGSLIAVIYYFRQEIRDMITSWFKSVFTFKMDANARLAWAVLFGTIPVGIAGLLFKDFIEENLRTPLVLATSTLIFGLLLWAADAWGKRERNEHSMKWLDVLIIGLSQAMAIIPGTSRSGATMTAALMLGFTRQAAARFSFLLSIPVIVLGGSFLGLELARSSAPVDWSGLAIAVVLSALSAWLCIHYFLLLLEKLGMLPFVIYRIILALFLYAMFWNV